TVERLGIGDGYEQHPVSPDVHLADRHSDDGVVFSPQPNLLADMKSQRLVGDRLVVTRIEVAPRQERNPNAGVLWKVQSRDRNLETASVHIVLLIVLNEPAYPCDARHALDPSV